jgi:hypothetical protein
VIVGATGTKVLSTRKGARFTFGASEPSSFICRIDSREFQPCTSPFKAPRLRPGHHTFDVQAIDPAGNPSPVTSFGFQVKKPARHKKRHR